MRWAAAVGVLVALVAVAAGVWSSNQEKVNMSQSIPCPVPGAAITDDSQPNMGQGGLAPPPMDLAAPKEYRTATFGLG